MALQWEKSVKIGVKTPFPGFVEPALAAAVDKVPEGTRWIHEIKFDGYRVQVHLRDATVKCSPGAEMTGPNASGKLPTTPGT